MHNTRQIALRTFPRSVVGDRGKAQQLAGGICVLWGIAILTQAAVVRLVVVLVDSVLAQ